MSPTRAQLSAQAVQNSAQARHTAGCCGDWFSITAAGVRQTSAQLNFNRMCSGATCAPPRSRHMPDAFDWHVW
jgi:hypothetical protein